MVECNRFEISASISEGKVSWYLRTDLPEKTIVMLSANRLFLGANDRRFVWPIFEDRFFCLSTDISGVNGSIGGFSIEDAEADSILGLKHILSNEAWAKTRTVDSLDLVLDFYTVPYQRELIDKFGEDNSLLCGSSVNSHGSVATQVIFQHPYSFRMDAL